MFECGRRNEPVLRVPEHVHSAIETALHLYIQYNTTEREPNAATTMIHTAARLI